MKKILVTVIVGVVAICLLAGLALALFWRPPANPPVVKEINWDSPQTRALAVRACYDCHSNETIWPWYSSLPPIAPLVRNDVEEGRSRLNFSEWGRGEQEIDDVAEVLQEGEMPPALYLMMHPKARLSADETQALIKGLITSAGGQYEAEGDDD